MTRYIKHALIMLLIRGPLMIAGTVILAPLTYFYLLGEFPKIFRWYDDYRGYRMRLDPSLDCNREFGQGHCDLFIKYNSSWYLRYVWCAWRNSTNYFGHAVLGKYPEYTDYVTKTGNFMTLGKLWEYSRIEGNHIKIPGLNLYIRLRFGHKINGEGYVSHMRILRFPLEFVGSIGIRRTQ